MVPTGIYIFKSYFEVLNLIR